MIEIKKGQVWESIRNPDAKFKVQSVEGKSVVVRPYPRGVLKKIRANRFNPEHKDGFKLCEGI